MGQFGANAIAFPLSLDEGRISVLEDAMERNLRNIGVLKTALMLAVQNTDPWLRDQLASTLQALDTSSP
jgi:hypothetical protein